MSNKQESQAEIVAQFRRAEKSAVDFGFKLDVVGNDEFTLGGETRFSTLEGVRIFLTALNCIKSGYVKVAYKQEAGCGQPDDKAAPITNIKSFFLGENKP